MNTKAKRYSVDCPVCGEQRLVHYNTWRDIVVKRATGTCRACSIERMRLKPPALEHGASIRHPKLFDCWHGLLRRCENPSFKAYPYYGGKGVKLCPEWREDPHAFIDWALEHGWKEGLSIDRIDNDGDYCPENCRWATRREQSANTSRSRPITYKGRTQTLGEWANELGFNGGSLYNRVVRLKWPIEKAFETPMRAKAPNGSAKAK